MPLTPPFTPHAKKGAHRQPALFNIPASPKPKTPGMPGWLKRALETKTGGFRQAHWNRCPNCGQIILTGLDADTCAFTINADPTPITPRQEQLCALTGRPTYYVTAGQNRIELDRRDTYSIGRPSPHYPIVPAHKCGARFPGFLLPPETKTQGATNNDCPF